MCVCELILLIGFCSGLCSYCFRQLQCQCKCGWTDCESWALGYCWYSSYPFFSSAFGTPGKASTLAFCIQLS